MEDAHSAELQLDEDNRTKNAFFAVYDGHGGAPFLVTVCFGRCLISADSSDLLKPTGASVAKYAGKNVFKRLVGEQSYKDGNYQEGLKKAFLGTDEDILKSEVPSQLSFFFLLTCIS